MLANSQAGRPDGIVPQKAYRGVCAPSAYVRKGEKVVQETTGGAGDSSGQANPTESKAKQGQVLGRMAQNRGLLVPSSPG